MKWYLIFILLLVSEAGICQNNEFNKAVIVSDSIVTMVKCEGNSVLLSICNLRESKVYVDTTHFYTNQTENKTEIYQLSTTNLHTVRHVIELDYNKPVAVKIKLDKPILNKAQISFAYILQNTPQFGDMKDKIRAASYSIANDLFVQLSKEFKIILIKE